MAPAPSLVNGSGLMIQPSKILFGLSIGSAIAENPAQHGEIGSGLMSQPGKILSGVTPPSQKGEQKANRESLRLETLVTLTKQRPTLRSNREIDALFPKPIDLPSSTRQKMISSPRKPPANSKNTTTLPSVMFRLKSTPILCFLQLAGDFNRTMFRLERRKIEPAAQRDGLPHRNISATKNGRLRPMCYAANLGPPEFAWGKN
jgi:hypothetical protein